MRFWLLFLPLWLVAAMLQKGDAVPPLELEDQFGMHHKTGEEKVWIVTWDKMTTRRANLFFEAHPEQMKKGEVAMLVDVSQTPEGIMNLFVLPRMQSYAHRILLSRDAAYNRNIPYEEGSVTLLYLKGGVVTDIKFAEDGESLEALLR